VRVHQAGELDCAGEVALVKKCSQQPEFIERKMGDPEAQTIFTFVAVPVPAQAKTRTSEQVQPPSGSPF